MRLQQLTDQDPYRDPEHTNDNAAIDTDASEEDGHDRIQALIDELNVQIHATEKALKKIDDGTYGICEVTGKHIPEDRLRAFPTATTIVGA